MNYRSDHWRRYGYALDSFERSLSCLHYVSVFEPVTGPPQLPYSTGFFTVRPGSPADVTATQIETILDDGGLGEPHGRSLLQPRPFPDFPRCPEPPDQTNEAASRHLQRRDKLVLKAQAMLNRFQEIHRKDIEMLQWLERGYKEGNERYVEFLAELALKRHHLAAGLQRPTKCRFEPNGKVLLCQIEVPDFAHLPITKRRGKSHDLVEVSTTEKKKLNEILLHSLCIRAAYLIARADFGGSIETIAVNANQDWFDPATGAPRSGTIASLQALKTDLLALQPGRFEAKACFAHLKGISTPSVSNISPVRPIFVLDKDDGRIVVNKNVDAGLQAEENLAAIPWEDFEHLVRQLFEWEFGRNGVEVKVTRASRDRGVDAIMYDPDPLRGGKYVLQAKRYTRTVDVAAVRDLYGTVMNEGANRGILVTTSGFGPDSYEFAKDKPISLVDGQNLIAMLRRHGKGYRIDLTEARAAGPSSP